MLSKPRLKPQSGAHLASRNRLESGPNVERLGYWSARLMTVLTFVLAVSLLLTFFGMATQTLSVLVCLLLAPCLIVMSIATYHQAPQEARAWSEIGIFFAVLYALVISGVYYVQLAPGSSWHTIALIVPDTGTVLFAINMLAFALLLLSTGCVARVVAEGDGVSFWIKRLLMLNAGLVLPTMLAPVILPDTAIAYAWAESNAGVVALLLWCFLYMPVPDLIRARFVRLGVHRACGVIHIR